MLWPPIPFHTTRSTMTLSPCPAPPREKTGGRTTHAPGFSSRFHLCFSHLVHLPYLPSSARLSRSSRRHSGLLGRRIDLLVKRFIESVRSPALLLIILPALQPNFVGSWYHGSCCFLERCRVVRPSSCCETWNTCRAPRPGSNNRIINFRQFCLTRWVATLTLLPVYLTGG